VIAGNTNANAWIGGAGGNTIRGNYIGTNAAGDAALGGAIGIELRSANNVVGGTEPGEGNLISGHSSFGISGAFDIAFGNTIQGNLVGTDRTGTEPLANLNGIRVSDHDNLVGGLSPGARNVISGNTHSGLGIHGCGVSLCSGTVVQGNLIGTDVTGRRPLANATTAISGGIELSSAHGVLIGGTASGARNVIAGNNGSGIHFFNISSRNRIEGNFIGVDVDGNAMRNAGAGIRCCGISGVPGRDNVIGGIAAGAGNVIAFNGGAGVSVETGAASILGNSIHSNTRLGIDLIHVGPRAGEPTANDEGDTDTGPNDVQNFPVISHVDVSGGQTSAQVSLNSVASTDFRLEFFHNRTCDNTRSALFLGFFGEGETFVGARTVRTDAAGNWSGTVALPVDTAPSELITATATQFSEPGVSLAGSTSELSECLADLSIRKLDNPDPVGPGGTLTYTLEIENGGPAPSTDVRLTDTLAPSGVTVVSIEPSQGSCSLFGRFIVGCTLGRIDRGETATVTITVTVSAFAGTTLTNTASVTSNEIRDHDPSDNTATATTQVVPSDFELTLSPASATNDVGTEHTVTATLTESGNAAAGKTITFTVTGANSASGTTVTDSTGDATFAYTGTNAGSDTIVACYDVNNDQCTTGDTIASATKEWVDQPAPPDAADDTLVTDEDQPGEKDVLANDTGPSLTVTAFTQGAHGTVSCTTAGVCTYTPEADYSGSDSFTYTASNGDGNDTATVNVTVNPVNDPPVAVDDSTSTPQGVAKAVDVLTNDSDRAHGSVSCTSGVCTYTPNDGFAGSDSFTYEISDRKGGSDTGTVNLTVTPVGQAGVSGKGVFNTAGNGQVSFTLSSTAVKLARTTGQRFTFDGVVASVVGGAATATMTGSGTWKGLSGHTFEITVVDKGSPGYKKGDTITVVIRNPSGAPVFSWGPERLKTGDIVVTAGAPA
jgi:uncharacterized repeat protein (TIGR01451 family)